MTILTLPSFHLIWHLIFATINTIFVFYFYVTAERALARTNAAEAALARVERVIEETNIDDTVVAFGGGKKFPRLPREDFDRLISFLLPTRLPDYVTNFSHELKRLETDGRRYLRVHCIIAGNDVNYAMTWADAMHLTGKSDGNINRFWDEFFEAHRAHFEKKGGAK